MRRRFAVWTCVVMLFTLALPGIGVKSAARFQALYWPAFQEDIYALSPGGGFGDYLALAARGSLMAFIRREYVAKPAAALTLYDLSSARALHTLPLAAQDWADSWQLGFWGPGTLYTLHEDSHTLTLYDQALKETLSFTPPPGFDAAFPDLNHQALWCASFDGASLTRFSLPGGEALVIPSGLPVGWQFAGFAGTSAGGGVLSVFSNPQGQSVFLTADATGSTHLMPIMAGFIWREGGLCHATAPGDALLMPMPGDARVLRLKDWREDEYVALYQDGLLMTEAYGAGPALRLIDLNRGEAIASLEAPAGETPLAFSHMALSDLGYAVLADNQYELNVYSLYLWDFRQAPQASPVMAEETTISGLRAQNDALAQRIAQKHDVTLHIRQAGAGFINDAYFALPLDQEPSLSHSLSKLEKTLDLLPPGLLREAYTAEHDRLGIYLTGGLRPKTSAGLYAPGGFTSSFGDERFIALDISASEGIRILAHELMHLLEDRLAQPGEPGSRVNMLDDWLLLSPPQAPDRGYFYQYLNEDGLEIYDTALTADDPQAWNNPDDIWFIDAYSRTFPSEDRARVFESLFNAGETLPDFFKSPHLLRKAQYLAAMLRERYTSLKDAPALPWERHLSPIPYDTFRQEFDALDAAARP